MTLKFLKSKFFKINEENIMNNEGILNLKYTLFSLFWMYKIV